MLKSQVKKNTMYWGRLADNVRLGYILVVGFERGFVLGHYVKYRMPWPANVGDHSATRDYKVIDDVRGALRVRDDNPWPENIMDLAPTPDAKDPVFGSGSPVRMQARRLSKEINYVEFRANIDRQLAVMRRSEKDDDELDALILTFGWPNMRDEKPPNIYAWGVPGTDDVAYHMELHPTSAEDVRRLISFLQQGSVTAARFAELEAHYADAKARIADLEALISRTSDWTIVTEWAADAIANISARAIVKMPSIIRNRFK